MHVDRPLMRLAFVSGFALAASNCIAAAAPCTAPDNVTKVTGASECLVIRTFARKTGGQATLVVVIHGDVSRGGPATYHFRLADWLAGGGAVAVALVRPGYDDGAGNISSGELNDRFDNYTAANIDAVAGAVRALRAHHRAQRVILVGHSGGAAISAVILGKHPGTADGAVLIACPCHLANWRSGRRPFARSESPHSYAAAVPASARIIAVTGSRDDNTIPSLASNYVATLAARGVRARFVEVAGAGHNDAVDAAEVTQAIGELVGGR